MKEQFSLVYACPHCRAPLDLEKDIVVQGEIREGLMWCVQDEHQFPIKKGIPRLMSDPRYEPVTQEVEEAGERHVIVEDPYHAQLPHKTLKHRQTWELRMKTCEHLLKLLREANRRRILHIGGDGWLSNRLADYYEVFALDVNPGPTGLEAADLYLGPDKYFERAQGEPTNLPLADKSMDIAVCSAPLNKYNPSVVIGEVTRVLKDDGILFLLNSKLYNTAEGAQRALEEEDTFSPLFKKDLDKELGNNYTLTYLYPDMGAVRSLTKQFLSVVTRKEYPTYPIIRAVRTH